MSIAQALVVPNDASFIRAARILGVQKSAAGCRVQALEDRLGASLFERQSSGVRLTKVGRCFFFQTCLAFAEIYWTDLRDKPFVFGREEGDGALINLVPERYGEIDQHPEVNRDAVARDVVVLPVALGRGVTLMSEPIAANLYPDVIFRPLAEKKSL